MTNENGKRGPDDQPKIKPLSESFWHNNPVIIIFLCIFLLALILIVGLLVKGESQMAIGVFSTLVGSIASFIAGHKTSKK